jgi:hypothetical protein
MLATNRLRWYTVSQMKQPVSQAFHLKLGVKKAMNTEYIWETFDGLWKALHRQGRRVEELESRVVELESRLAERAASLEERRTAAQPAAAATAAEFPVERAA